MGGGVSAHEGRLKLEVDGKMTVETWGGGGQEFQHKAYRGWLSNVLQGRDGRAAGPLT